MKQKKPPARQRFQMTRKKKPSYEKHGLCFVLINHSWVVAFPGVWFIQPMMVHWKTRNFSFLRVLTETPCRLEVAFVSTSSSQAGISRFEPVQSCASTVWVHLCLCPVVSGGHCVLGVIRHLWFLQSFPTIYFILYGLFLKYILCLSLFFVSWWDITFRSPSS